MRQETQWTTIFWEGWTALALCAAAVFWPGSAALGYPAVLWPGLALAAAVPVLWAGWWLWAEKAPPLPEEELMAKPGRIHIVTEDVFLLVKVGVRACARGSFFFWSNGFALRAGQR